VRRFVLAGQFKTIVFAQTPFDPHPYLVAGEGLTQGLNALMSLLAQRVRKADAVCANEAFTTFINDHSIGTTLFNERKT
jgi:hypothetical protein